ncbi:MAG: helix-turn-helix domain-containing protein [Arachnia sp.]
MSQFERALARRLADPEFKAGYEDERRRRDLIKSLARWRGAAGMSQRELAVKMGVGQSTVAGFEGSADPRLSTVQRHARAVDAQVFFFVAPRQTTLKPRGDSTVVKRMVWGGRAQAASERPQSMRSDFAKAA